MMRADAADLTFLQEYAPIIAPGGALLVGAMTVGAQLWIAKLTRDSQRQTLADERQKAIDEERITAYRIMIEVLLRMPTHPGPPYSIEKSLAWTDRVDQWLDDFRLSLWAVLRHEEPHMFRQLSGLADQLRAQFREIQSITADAGETVARLEAGDPNPIIDPINK